MMKPCRRSWKPRHWCVRTRHCSLPKEQKVRASLKEIRTRLTREKLRRGWIPGRHSSRPGESHCSVVFPRSGTTLLEQVLDSHPDIVSAEETPIFHDDAYVPLVRHFPEDTPLMTILESVPTDALQQSRQNYFRCVELFLGNPIAGRLLLDKNPYLTDSDPRAGPGLSGNQTAGGAA